MTIDIRPMAMTAKKTVKLWDSGIFAFVFRSSTFKYEPILIKKTLWMLTLLKREFCIKWSITSKVIKGQKSSSLNFKIIFFLRYIFCLMPNFKNVNILMTQICMNANIMKTQFFDWIIYGLKCHFYVIEKFFCSCLFGLSGLFVKVGGEIYNHLPEGEQFLCWYCSFFQRQKIYLQGSDIVLFFQFFFSEFRKLNWKIKWRVKTDNN